MYSLYTFDCIRQSAVYPRYDSSMSISSVTQTHYVSVHVQRDAISVHARISVCVRGVNELSCFDTSTDPVLAGRMTTLIEWLPEYSNEVILPHQMMKNSCYKLV